MVTKSLLNGNSKLKWLFRENNSIGTGWVAFGDTDTQEYIDKAENLSVVDFNTLANIEPTVRNVFICLMERTWSFVLMTAASILLIQKQEKK